MTNSEMSIGPAGDFMRTLWRLNHELERVSSAMESVLGVSSQQRMMIRFVGKFPGVTATQVAAHFFLDAATVSVAIGRLEAKGLVIRRRSDRDKRRVTLGLTAAGREVDKDVVGTVESAVSKVLHQTPEEQLLCVRNVLGSLTEMLHNEAPRTLRK